MNSIVSFRKCTLTNDQLLEKVDQMTDGLFDVKHKSERERILTRHIPAQPNSDYDLLIGELLVRFKELSDSLDTAITGLEWWNSEHPEDSKECDLSNIEKWKKQIESFCSGSCGSNYCDEHGCVDRKPTANENVSIQESKSTN